MNRAQIRLRIFLVIFIIVMVLGTLGFMTFENTSFSDALYFSIVTVSTVGYGDIHPATAGGKALAVFLIIMGVGTFLGIIAESTEVFLNRREARVRHQKINMVIGAFFSEVGMALLAIFARSDPDLEKIRADLIVTTQWNPGDFQRVRGRLGDYSYALDIEQVDMENLRDFLAAKREFMVRLLENPVLLEDESFTELLRAVFHATEELSYRRDIAELPRNDRLHLAGDLKRVYRHIVFQWFDYMKYLKDNYPYLFSLAMRTNPFDRASSPVIS
ncbi:MAG: two pore domain potassium channel family protein [Deltaproteobacteria bacterium]|nr:two pore domain potassium channel family protein [Deltaproteobacteria bacterium]